MRRGVTMQYRLSLAGHIHKLIPDLQPKTAGNVAQGWVYNDWKDSFLDGWVGICVTSPHKEIVVHIQSHAAGRYSFAVQSTSGGWIVHDHQRILCNATPDGSMHIIHSVVPGQNTRATVIFFVKPLSHKDQHVINLTAVYWHCMVTLILVIIGSGNGSSPLQHLASN